MTEMIPDTRRPEDRRKAGSIMDMILDTVVKDSPIRTSDATQLDS